MFLRVINGGVRQWLALGLSLTLITARAVVSGSNLTVVRAEPETTLQYFGAFNRPKSLPPAATPAAPLTHGLLDIHVDDTSGEVGPFLRNGRGNGRPSRVPCG